MNFITPIYRLTSNFILNMIWISTMTYRLTDAFRKKKIHVRGILCHLRTINGKSRRSQVLNQSEPCNSEARQSQVPNRSEPCNIKSRASGTLSPVRPYDIPGISETDENKPLICRVAKVRHMAGWLIACLVGIFDLNSPNLGFTIFFPCLPSKNHKGLLLFFFENKEEKGNVENVQLGEPKAYSDRASSPY